MGYTSAQAKSFIKEIAPLIQAEARKRSYKICSTVIAQAIIESGITSVLAVKYHNYFGMKCGNSWRGKSVNLRTKEEYTVGALTSIRDNFRAYDSMVEGVAGYYDFISTKRYANLKTATDYVQYAEYLKKDGYATSSTYVNTLTSTVRKYDLTKYDSDTVTVAQEENYNMKTIKKGSKGTAVKIWQIIVNVEADGVFGADTERATKDFQRANGLTVDGIVGAKSWKAGLEAV